MMCGIRMNSLVDDVYLGRDGTWTTWERAEVHDGRCPGAVRHPAWDRSVRHLLIEADYLIRRESDVV